MLTLLCTCNGTVPLDPGPVTRALGDGAHVRVLDALCRAREIPSAPDGAPVFLGCRRETARLRDMLEEAGTPPCRVAAWDLADALRGLPRGEAAARASAAVRAARALLEHAEPPPAWAVPPGSRVVVGGSGSLPVAGALAPLLDVLWVGEEPAPPGLRSYPGQILSVEGALGAFRVRVGGTSPVDPWVCVGCGACRDVCPRGALDGRLRLDPDLCDGCGRCESACARVGALDLGLRERAVGADQVIWIGGPGPSRPGLHLPGTVDEAVAAAARAVAHGLGDAVEAWAAVTPDPARCGRSRAGMTGCSLCLDACPTGAVVPRGDAVAVEHVRCTGCGACAGVCPTGGIRALPWGFAAVGEALETLGRAGAAVALVCEDHPAAAAPGEIPVPLPHLGSVAWTHLAAAVGAGAPWVRLLPCPGCRAGLEEALRAARDVLARVGLQEHVFLGSEGPAEGHRTPAPFLEGPLPWDGPLATRAALLAPLIRSTPGAPPLAGPFGTVGARRDGCTGCGACAGACPTGAVTADSREPRILFTGVRCTGCGLCAAGCPEGVLEVRPHLEWATASLSPREIARAEAHACPRCGRVFATRQALEAVASRLAGRFPPLSTDTLSLCPDCRAVHALQEDA